jgi:rRNA maturation RNase YbeY
VTTALQLLELSHPDHPLLRRLMLRAPGTYHHSLMIGNLAESAAEQIGADALVARVMAYYHDIGKLESPTYFAENQAAKANIHDSLPPAESARLIRKHVLDGLRLARQYHLPRVIQDGIAEHHGLNLVGFFYRQAMQQQPDQPLNILEFTYPGPKPQSKETASGHGLVVDWGGSALQDVDRAFVQAVLEGALAASGDARLAGHAIWLLSVGFIGDEEMAVLNGQYRGVAATTDVLSFPQLEALPGGEDDSPAERTDGAAGQVLPMPLVLGDVVMSLPRARAQAEGYGHSLEREVGFLLVHSVLHLLGHDHQGDEERRVMRREEERILGLLSLARDEG